MSIVKIKRALISVSDKTGLLELAAELNRHKVEILSTGGTLKALQDAKIKSLAVDQYTGFPEMLDGRVKTLHPKIHGGLLYRRDMKSHVAQARKNGIRPIDLVVVNLYPFEKVTSRKGVSLEEAIENIDIGGPSMLRSAAKNFDAVTVVCDPSDYGRVLADLKQHGGVTLALRRELALKVFERTHTYDAAIAGFLKSRVKTSRNQEALPEKLDLLYTKTQDLRYGENPHQRAALYVSAIPGAHAGFTQLHGKELSFNNLMDIEAVLDILREFSESAACVVKHNNPCGIGENKNLARAVEMAVDSDPLSAFGGIVGTNRPCDVKTAQALLKKLGFFEVIVAAKFHPKALALLTARKNLRVIETGTMKPVSSYDVRVLKTGVLVQDRDKPVPAYRAFLKKNLKFVTKTKLKGAELDELLFAWKCAKVVKSNAIVLTQGHQTVGVGAGQMSRVDSVYVACRKAGEKAKGAMLGSDAFFPMADGIEAAAEHKIRAIIQPGGSIRDADVIAACDKFGIAMAFTGRRHFRH